MPTAHFFCKETKKELTYYPTWFPTTPIEVGEIGTLDKSIFISEKTTLRDIGIDFSISAGESRSDDSFSFSSAGIKENILTIGTESQEIAKTRIEISFGRKSGIVFKAKGGKVYQMMNLPMIKQKVEEMYHEGKWNKDWVVITEIVQVDSATIIISNAENAQITLEAAADVNAHQINIADASLDLTIKNKRYIYNQWIAESSLSPLFRMRGMRPTWFLGKKEFSKVKSAVGQDPNSVDGSYLKDSFRDIELEDLKDE